MPCLRLSVQLGFLARQWELATPLENFQQAATVVYCVVVAVIMIKGARFFRRHR